MGCGRIAQTHAKVLGDHLVKNAKLTAVCDSDFPRAAALGEKYKVPAYASLEEMVKAHPEIDVVNVVTPSGLHAEHAIRVANLGKHVIVEKPMALKLAWCIFGDSECATGCPITANFIFISCLSQSRNADSIAHFRGS